MAGKVTNKSEVIRGLLREIGADRGQPPVNMVSTIQSRLEKRGIKVSTPLIYQLRSQLIKENARSDSKAHAKAQAKQPPKLSPKPAAKGSSLAEALPQVRNVKAETVTLEHLMAIKSIVSKLGGIGRFRKAFDAYESLVGPAGPWPFPSS